MTTITLPTTPLPQSANPKPLDFGSWQEPIAGGTITRLDRLGSRLAIDIQMPRLKPEPDGRIWVARLNQAIGQEVLLPFPQPGLPIGTPGSPVIDGAGQAGNTISVRGFTAAIVLAEGRFFSIVSGGRRFLHQVSVQDYLVDGAGKKSFLIWPNLRISPADGDVCEFAQPFIQGRLTGNADGWTLERAGTRGLRFTITELR